MPTHEVISRMTVREKPSPLRLTMGPTRNSRRRFSTFSGKPGPKPPFFMIGTQMEKSLGTAQAVHEQGHEIGNHTYTHPALPEVSPDECRRELAQTEELIVRVTGSKPRVFRPPYVAITPRWPRLRRRIRLPLHRGGKRRGHDWEMPGVRHIVDKNAGSADAGQRAAVPRRLR